MNRALIGGRRLENSKVATRRRIDDIREVSNHVDAMMYGLEAEALPQSLRLTHVARRSR